MAGRTLHQREFKYHLRGQGPCKEEQVESGFEGSIHTIELNLEEVVYSLLQPVYDQFAFTNLPRRTVDLVSKEALSY